MHKNNSFRALHLSHYMGRYPAIDAPQYLMAVMSDDTHLFFGV